MSGSQESAKVSIVMPAYNAARYIKQAIDSVRAQTYQDWELLVVDDGSTDETLSIIRQYAAQDARIIAMQNTIRHMPACPAGPRNMAIAAAKGRYTAFLDADDWWGAEKLEKQVRFMAEKQAIMSHHSYWLCYEGGEKKSLQVASPKVSYIDFLKGKRVLLSSVMLDTKPQGKLLFTEMALSSDTAGWMLFLRQNKAAASYEAPEAIAFYRLTPGSLSSRKFKMANSVWKILRCQEKLTLTSAIYYFVCYAVSSVVQRKFR